jgi:hypothetical protein
MSPCTLPSALPVAHHHEQPNLTASNHHSPHPNPFPDSNKTTITRAQFLQILNHHTNRSITALPSPKQNPKLHHPSPRIKSAPPIPPWCPDLETTLPPSLSPPRIHRRAAIVPVLRQPAKIHLGVVNFS